MTQLGKIIITAGIIILTAGSLMWIVKDNWQYFAGSAAIFVGCILSGIVVSIETKSPNGGGSGNQRFNSGAGIPYRPSVREERLERSETKLESTDPYPTIPTSGNWSPPSIPPPDAESDPFYGKRTDA